MDNSTSGVGCVAGYLQVCIPSPRTRVEASVESAGKEIDTRKKEDG